MNQAMKYASELERKVKVLKADNLALLEACQTALSALARGDCQDIAIDLLRKTIKQTGV